MTDSDQPSPETNPLHHLLNGLDLTPQWAKKDPGVEGDRSQRDSDRDRGHQGPRAPKRSARSDLAGVRIKPKRDLPPRGGAEHRDSGPRPPFRAPRLPVHVDFIPDKNRLSKVVKVIRQSRRAYPVEEIAGRFMADPRFLSVKFTPREKTGDAPVGDAPPALTFFQCKADGMVFTTRSACEAYVLAHGVDAYYDKQNREVPPPTGNFLCVGRLKRTGTLIGPPNWHGYAKRLEELRLEHFPARAADDMASEVEMVREPEHIDAWKASVSHQEFYRLKTDTEGEYTLSREQAETEFREKTLPSFVVESPRAILPGHLIEKLEDPGLKDATDHHLRRERENPASIIFALRPAFKHMRLHLFRHNGQMFVSGIQPNPLPADEHVVKDIRLVLDYLAEHPDCSPPDLLTALCPDLENKTFAAELVSHLHWLIEKGHVIEFSNSTLSLPHTHTR